MVLLQMAEENGVQGWIKRYINAKTMLDVGLARKYIGLETFYFDIRYQHRITPWSLWTFNSKRLSLGITYSHRVVIFAGKHRAIEKAVDAGES